MSETSYVVQFIVAILGLIQYIAKLKVCFTQYSLLCYITANVGAFIFGMLLGWSAPIAPEIVEQHDFYFWIEARQFTWMAALMALGASLSCILSGILRNRIGTKATIFLYGIPIVVGWTMLAIPINPAMVSEFKKDKSSAKHSFNEKLLRTKFYFILDHDRSIVVRILCWLLCVHPADVCW